MPFVFNIKYLNRFQTTICFSMIVSWLSTVLNLTTASLSLYWLFTILYVLLTAVEMLNSFNIFVTLTVHLLVYICYIHVFAQTYLQLKFKLQGFMNKSKDLSNYIVDVKEERYEVLYSLVKIKSSHLGLCWLPCICWISCTHAPQYSFSYTHDSLIPFQSGSHWLTYSCDWHILSSTLIKEDGKVCLLTGWRKKLLPDTFRADNCWYLCIFMHAFASLSPPPPISLSIRVSMH